MPLSHFLFFLFHPLCIIIKYHILSIGTGTVFVKIPILAVKERMPVFQVVEYKGTKEANYLLLIKQLKALVEDEENRIANLSNASALLNQFLTDINWVGFYLLEKDELVLGPFQGLPACVRIPVGKGVCGTAARERKAIRVPDVEQFPGHIACDARSRSEIVLPLIADGELIGVLDIDSPLKDRFDETDEKYLQMFADVLAQYVK